MVTVTTANGTGLRSPSPSSFMRHARARPSSLSHAFTLVLAVCFTAPGVGECWDNNGGNIFLLPMLLREAGALG
jgi:hypothetical protein